MDRDRGVEFVSGLSFIYNTRLASWLFFCVFVVVDF